MGMAEPPAAQSGADYSDLGKGVPEHFGEPIARFFVRLKEGKTDEGRQQRASGCYN